MTDHIRFGGKCIGNFILVCVMLLIIGCSGSDTIVKEISDGGSSTETGNPDNTITIAGYAQKGPFDEFCTVNLAGLNDNFEQTGQNFSDITDSAGRFEIPAQLSSDYAELNIRGFYFDELSYDKAWNYISSESMTIGAIADISDNNAVNINVLTTIAKEPVLALIEGSMTFDQAYLQTCENVLSAFNITDDTNTLFEDMVMLETPGTVSPEGNKILLAVSAIIMQMAHDTCGDSCTYVDISMAMNNIIGYISEDIALDGTLDDPTLITGIENGIMSLELENIRTHLEDNFPAYQIPAFEEYILGNLNIQWIGFDCATNGISSVEAVIYDPETGNINAGPWPCSDQESTNIALNAGEYDLVTVNFLDDLGDTAFQAEATDIAITFGQTTNLDIVPGSFTAGGVSVQWTSDCPNNDIASIQATVYNGIGTEIQTAGPWSCDDNTRSIGDISALTGGSILFVYSDLQDNEICRAELTNIDVTAGQTTNIGPLEIIPPEITHPLSGSTFREGDSITFVGTGSDFQGNPLSGDNLVWTSDIDNQIGTGETLDSVSLSYGIHTITLTAVDNTIGSISMSIILHIRTAGRNIYVGPGETYTTIQSAIDAADPYDRIIVRDGTYTESLNVNKELTIVSENGYSQTTVAATRSDYVFRVTRDYVRIEGFTIYGATRSSSKNGGIYLDWADHCTITNNWCGVDATNFNGVGIELRYGHNNVISNNLCHFNSQMGINLYRSDNNTISGNTCDSNDYDGISIVGNNINGHNNRILNNTVSNSIYGIRSRRNSNNVISGNICTLNSGQGIKIYDSEDNTISNNVCETNPRGIEVSGPSINNYILYNICSSNTHTGIFIWERSDENTVSGNICSSNSYFGISIGSDRNTISDNTCSLNMTGIYLNNLEKYTVLGNTVSGNTCSKNQTGIQIGSATSATPINACMNTISKNIISLNTNQGIYISLGADNTIYFNDLINNSPNIASTGNVNIWNSPAEITYTYNGTDYTGYLGNYYSDHNLTDSNGDGITDNPYVLSGDEPDDMYPLADTLDNFN